MVWVKRIAMVLFGLAAAFVVVGLVTPNRYQLQQSVVINASTTQIHALVGDLKRWDDWAPWKDQDPTIVVTFGDKTSGVGASQAWTDRDGGGRLTFTGSDVDKGIVYDMMFLMGKGPNPKAIPSVGELRYKQLGAGVEVTWAMRGEMSVPVLGGYLARMMPRQVAPMFRRGLDKLKVKAEAEPVPAPPVPVPPVAPVDDMATIGPTGGAPSVEPTTEAPAPTH